MKRLIIGIALPALLALCLVWMGCGGSSTGPDDGDNAYSAVEDFYYSFEVDEQSGLRIEAISGTVTVRGVSGVDSVIIKGTKRVRAPSQEDADERLHGLNVIVKNVTDEVSAKTTQPSDTEGRSYEVDYEITMPPEMAVMVSSVNGTITIQDVASDLTISSTNGGVVLDDYMGDATIYVVNGTVVGDVTLPLSGEFVAVVVNGSVGLEIPADTSAEFSAHITNGGISTSGLAFTDLETTSTSVTGTLGDGEGIIGLTVTNGTILVTGT